MSEHLAIPETLITCKKCGFTAPHYIGHDCAARGESESNDNLD